MLGFDALGKLALGQLPSAGRPFSSSLQVAPSRPRSSIAAQALGSSMVLLTTVPFVQSNWAQAKPIRPAAVDQVQYNSKIYTNDVPFRSTTEFRGTINLRLATAPDQLHTNIARFTNPIPFGPFDWSSKPLYPEPAPQPPTPNRIHLSSVVASAPFSQGDWSKPFVPVAGQPFAQLRNINIFSAVPFSQDDWATTRRVSSLPAPDRPYNALIYSEVPFDQSDWSKTRAATLQPPALPAYNPNLYGQIAPAPFVSIDWSKPFTIRSAPAAPATLNVNLFTNPIPFAQYDWSKPQGLEGALYPAPQPYNQNFYANPRPFAQFDWSKPSAFASGSSALQQFNPNLSTVVVQSPFYQTDWQVSVRQRFATPDQAGRNVNIFSEVPFAQLDWGRIAKQSALQDQPAYNLNLRTTVTQNPFFLTDWSVTVRAKLGSQDQVIRNPLIFSEVPFDQTDWSTPFRSKLPTVDQPSFNLNLFTTVVQNPIVPVDWSVVVRPRFATQDQVGRNPSLFSEVPFYQSEWARPYRLPPPFQSPTPVNVALLTATFSPMPFAKYDWVPARIPPVRSAELMQNFELLVSVAPPSPPSKRRPTLFMSNIGRMMGS